MMVKLLALFCLLGFLFATTCKKDEDDCHKEIKVQNNSDSTVIISQKIFGTTETCILTGSEIQSGENYTFDLLRGCYENALSDGRTEEIYVVAPYKINDDFNDCDSIEVYNHVLKKFNLSLDDLRATNFTVYYP